MKRTLPDNCRLLTRNRDTRSIINTPIIHSEVLLSMLQITYTHVDIIISGVSKIFRLKIHIIESVKVSPRLLGKTLSLSRVYCLREFINFYRYCYLYKLCFANARKDRAEDGNDSEDVKKRRLSEVHESSFTQLFPSLQCIMLSRRSDLKSSTSAVLLEGIAARLVIQVYFLQVCVIQRVSKIVYEER